jgi:hypothetical protein
MCTLTTGSFKHDTTRRACLLKTMLLLFSVSIIVGSSAGDVKGEMMQQAHSRCTHTQRQSESSCLCV